MKKSQKATRKAADAAAYRAFGLKKDPFSTLPLQTHNLDFFVGREDLLERLGSDLASSSNTALTGEPGLGKTSLLKTLEARVGRGRLVVSLRVSVDDAGVFLSDLLGELLGVVKSVPGLKLREVASHLRKGLFDRTALLRIVKTFLVRSKKPVVVFMDDVEKIRGDHVRHFSRSERTLQFLGELRPLFETERACFFATLQEEFHAKITQAVKEGAEDTVLGYFRNVVKLEPFHPAGLTELLRVRLERSGCRKGVDSFLEPEALKLALAVSGGNPRRFLFLMSEGMNRAAGRGRRVPRGSGVLKVEFGDVFDALNEHLKLDPVCRKLLFFLSKSGRATASNSDLQAFMGLDLVSVQRRLEILAKNRLAEMVEVVKGARVYALPGSGNPSASGDEAKGPGGSVGRSQKGERMFLLDGK